MDDLEKVARAIHTAPAKMNSATTEQVEGLFQDCKAVRLEQARAALEALTLQDLARLAARHGYSLVPDEPTEKMLRSAFAEMNRTPSGTWKAMKARKETPRRIFDVKMAPRYRAMIAAGRVKPERDNCAHDWISMKNEAIDSGLYCTICHAVKPE